MNSIVLSPFWQSLDEQWIGATLLAVSLAQLLSLALFAARSRSIPFFLLASGLIFLAATLLAPKADSIAPRMFRLWLLAPATLGTLSLTQILLTVPAVFGSVRLEAVALRRPGEPLPWKYKLWGGLVAALALLPSPMLLVFLFRLEQDLMISTREEMPVMIGLKVAATITVSTGLVALILSCFSRFRLMAWHVFVGIFLLLSGALLPCLTIRLSFESPAGPAPYLPNTLTVVAVFLGMFAVVVYGIFHRKHVNRETV